MVQLPERTGVEEERELASKDMLPPEETASGEVQEAPTLEVGPSGGARGSQSFEYSATRGWMQQQAVGWSIVEGCRSKQWVVAPPRADD